jgi:hypothetical protein
MKIRYSSKVKNDQYIFSNDGKEKVKMFAQGGEWEEKDAKMVQKSTWGKRLIEAGQLTIQPIAAAPVASPAAGTAK